MMRDKKSLRPVTINQLNTVDAKQDGEGFTLDGIDLDQVRIDIQTYKLANVFIK